MATETHGQASPALSNAQDAMRFWRDNIRRPIENGQTPTGEILETFERGVSKLLQQSGQPVGTGNS